MNKRQLPAGLLRIRVFQKLPILALLAYPVLCVFQLKLFLYFLVLCDISVLLIYIISD